MRAQFVPPVCPQVYPPPSPEAIGQWQGPFPTNIDQGIDNKIYPYPKTREIAHMALLPPSAANPSQTRVFLSALTGHGCQSGCGPLNTANQQYGRSGIITLGSTPSTAVPIPPPSTMPQDGSQDFFCGGHAFLPDGSLLWGGGSDYKRSCDEPIPDPNNPCKRAFFGHEFAYRLDTSTAIPSWVQTVNPMSMKRWYPTLVAYGSPARVGAFGHTSWPQQDAEDFREELLASTLTWNGLPIPNVIEDPICDTTDVLRVLDYPRMHMLRTGLLLHSNPLTTHPGWIPLKPFDWQLQPVKFLDIANPACPGNPRWITGHGNGGLPGMAGSVRLHGSSVYLIAWNGGDNYTEVVYAVGGSITEVGGNPCDCYPDPKSWQSESVYLNSVEKLVTHDTALQTIMLAGWDPSPPDLTFSRANHNTVLALDGRLVALGGTSYMNGQCVSRKVVESYAPPEIFGNPNAQWECWAEQDELRVYHSVAVLLPDGRIISGGGRAHPHDDDPAVDDNCLPNDPVLRWWRPAHSVEIFSPPYMFVPRPEIDAAGLPNPVTAPLEFGEPLVFDVELVNANDTVERVALVRNGSSTHGFDSDQRYVQLRVTGILTPDPETPRLREVTVLMPPDAYMAPQGYYLLTVVDQDQIPSKAEWIRLVDGP